MMTEIRPGNTRRASDKNSVCIRGWRHLHTLAGMEGRLMAIAAAQRVRGHLTASERTEIAFIGIEFVRAGYSIRPALNLSCAMLAISVEQLAWQIDAREWIWAVDYESGAWQTAQEGDDNVPENIFYGGIEYQPVPHRSHAVDASVYVQVGASGKHCFSVTEPGCGRQVAILPSMYMARHLASYAVSVNGGLGDVLISETSEKPTHMSFDAWLTDGLHLSCDAAAGAPATPRIRA
ncbi:hypothetical protein RN053_07015 [Pantoea dispersa]|uniref:hypothetical protein n=1 Tax=Pantoea dispersa TaxID=59814 RepID=UPI0028DF8684|nr:hypothetical protein [Pantoea dispersa]MDT8850231.1 hypothetical protein [Pantoea dispersa]